MSEENAVGLMPRRNRRSKTEASKTTNVESSSPMTPNGRRRRPGLENSVSSPKIENPYDYDTRTKAPVRTNEKRSSYRGYKDSGSGFNRGNGYHSKEPARKPESGQKSEEAFGKYDLKLIPDGALMIGDSMLKCLMLHMDEIPLNDLFLFSYPGIRAEGLAAEMKSEYLPPPRRVGTIILHVGTNNASQSREKSTVDECATEIINCIHMLRKLYPAALIFVSSILPRLDEENDRAVECNKIVAVYVNTKLNNDEDIRVLDFSKDFYYESTGKIKECFYRKSEIENQPTEDGKEPFQDTVHLSAEGGKYFTNLLHYCLQAAKSENKNREVFGSTLPTRKDWIEFRESEFGKFEKQRRHRETNYIAAQKKDYKYDKQNQDVKKSPSRDENYDEASHENNHKKPAENTHQFYNDGSGSQMECPYDEDEDSIASTFSANKQIIDWENKDEFDFDYDEEDMFAQAKKEKEDETPCEDDSNDGSSNIEKPLCAQEPVDDQIINEDPADHEETVEIFNMSNLSNFEDTVVEKADHANSEGMTDSDEFIIEEDQGGFDAAIEVEDLMKDVRKMSKEDVQVCSEPPLKKQAMMPSRKRKART